MYQVTVDEKSRRALGAGVDLGHTGYKAVRSTRRRRSSSTCSTGRPGRARRRARAQEVVPGPHVSETQIAQRLAAATARPRSRSRSRRPAATRRTRSTTSSAPTPSRAASRTRCRARRPVPRARQARRDRPVRPGPGHRRAQGHRRRAQRRRRRAARDALLRRQPRARVDRGRGRPAHAAWWLEHADDPQIAELLGRSELWFLPIQNPDGYDYTFTCGVGFRTAANEPCGATLVTDPADPLARHLRLQDAPTASSARRTRPSRTRRCASRPSACGARRCATTTATARTATARTASTRTATTRRPGAWTRRAPANSASSGTYRGPYPLSETEDLAYDRLLRRITPEAVINYHSAAQLLLYPFGYITDVYADDDPWFKAITGTDGDAAVDPYISQRSSDLYITNGETTDHAYNKYGVDGLDARARRVRDGGRRHVLRAAAPASRSRTTRARSRRSSRRTSTSPATSR